MNKGRHLRCYIFLKGPELSQIFMRKEERWDYSVTSILWNGKMQNNFRPFVGVRLCNDSVYYINLDSEWI